MGRVYLNTLGRCKVNCWQVVQNLTCLLMLHLSPSVWKFWKVSLGQLWSLVVVRGLMWIVSTGTHFWNSWWLVIKKLCWCSRWWRRSWCFFPWFYVCAKCCHCPASEDKCDQNSIAKVGCSLGEEVIGYSEPFWCRYFETLSTFCLSPISKIKVCLSVLCW